MNIYMKKYVEAAYALKNAKILQREKTAKLHSMYTGTMLARELKLLADTVSVAHANYIDATRALERVVEKVSEASVPRLFIGDCQEMLDVLKTGLVRTSSELLSMAEENKENMLFLRAAYEYAKKNNWNDASMKLIAAQDELFIDSRYAKEMLANLAWMFENPDHINAYENAGIISVYNENLTKLLKEYNTVEHADAMKAEEEKLAKEKQELEKRMKSYEEQKNAFSKASALLESAGKELDKEAEAIQQQSEEISTSEEAIAEAGYQEENAK